MKSLPGTGPLVIGALVVSLGIIALAYFYDGAGAIAPRGPLVRIGDENSQRNQNLAQLKLGDNPFADWQKVLGEAATGYSNATENANSSLSTTDTVGRQLFSGFLGLQQEGLLNDPASQDQILRQIVATTEASGTGKRYTSNDLSLIEETPQTLKTYLSSMGKTLQKTFTVKESELVTFARAVESKNPSDLKQLDVPIGIYTDIVDDLLSMPTPKSAASVHVSLLNNFSDLIAVLTTMEKLYDDPLGALASVKKIPEVQKSLQQSVADMGVYFTTRNVTP